MKRKFLQLFLQLLFPALFVLLLVASCKKNEPDKTSLIAGLWIQEKVTEDGVEMPLSNEEKSLSLLIEQNGAYRSYAKDAAQKEHFGVWTITDDTWLELSADSWRVVNGALTLSPENQWTKNHIPTRFTLLELSGNRLEIRLKTFTGNKKYSALFVEGIRPLITEENIETIDSEFKSQKTYIYTFIKN
jgi:hypothetical protein